ncbi:MAG: flagellar hook-basal body protein [Verrucomicrobiota bacterium]
MAQPLLGKKVVNVSLYQAASALNANTRWQEVISDNLAASGLPGYKKQDLSFAAVQAGLSSRMATMAPQPFSLTRAESSTNFLPGELQLTSSKTDLALEGTGFFAVQLANGSTAYTRDGSFKIDAQGGLTTKDGHPVLGDGGPIHIDLNDSTPISVSEAGEISQGSEVRGKLRVVDFQHPELLTPTSAGYFIAQNPKLTPIEVRQPSVRQGFLEGSNATAVVEMANLISVMRGYEANQRIIQLQDERMGRAISELGHPQ